VQQTLFDSVSTTGRQRAYTSPNNPAFFGDGVTLAGQSASIIPIQYSFSSVAGGSPLMYIGGKGVDFRTRAFIGATVITNSTGGVVSTLLSDMSHYKQSNINGWVESGTLVWYKLASDGDEINNYLTGTLLHNALIATPPTQPVTVYILDAGTDVSMILPSYNGQPVTVIPYTNKIYNFNMYDPIPSQQKNIEGLRMPRYATKGTDTSITTKNIDSNMYAILPYNCRIISTTTPLTLEIVPIANDTDTTVLISIPGGNILTNVPDFRAIRISGSSGYNSGTVTYWS